MVSEVNDGVDLLSRRNDVGYGMSRVSFDVRIPDLAPFWLAGFDRGRMSRAARNNPVPFPYDPSCVDRRIRSEMINARRDRQFETSDHAGH